MIELLTVIAIIAILSAILLPVLARAKDSAYRSSDIQDMNEIRSALQLYKVDNDVYPPAILGYASIYMTGPNIGQVIPANAYNGHLYSKRLPSFETLRPAYNREPFNIVVKAVWPKADNRAPGTAPILDLDGDGDIDANDDPSDARQAFDGTVVLAETPLAASPCNGGAPDTDACFYKVSGYDVAAVRDPANPGGMRNELRYARFWTVWGTGGGNAMDDPRQLGYDDPPESTVVTWNSFFREYDGGIPRRIRKELVLFLGGAARTFDSRDVHERSWRVMP